MIKKVVLYIRVSSEEQALHGDSLEAQEKALIEYAKKQGYKIVKIYRDEGYSARKPVFTRNAMKELIADAKTQMFELIIFTKIDRWFRSVREYHKVQEILEENKIHWKTILEDYDTSTADGRLKINIMLSVAENEADRTSERIKFVNEMKVRKKEPINGSQPWGYKCGIVDGKKRVVKDETQVEIIDAMFEHFLTYKSGSGTTNYLNKTFGTDTTRTRVIRALKNPVYTGEYRGIPEYRPPYITHEQHAEIMETFDSNLATKKSRVGRTYLFTGFIFCPECGRKLGARIKTPWGRSKKYYFSYRCPNHQDGRCSWNKTISELKVEKYLLDNVENKLNEYAMKVQVEEKTEEQTKPVRDVKKYEERLKRVNNAYFLGNMGEEEYIETTSEIKALIADINEEKPKRVKKDVEALKAAIPPNFREIYEGLRRENKRAVWLSIIKEIKVEDNEPIDVIFL